MESNQGRAMKITWVLADTVELDPTIDLDQLKNIGPFWGGWRTWRSYLTDNVVCHSVDEARNLVNKNFHTRCNLYIPTTIFGELGRPSNVKVYSGEFHEIVDHPDSIVSMHLAAAHSDIVLLLGFDISPKKLDNDKLAKHKWHNHCQYLYHIIKSNPEVQWVMLDHDPKIEKIFKDLPNLLFDSMSNVLTQFK